LSDTRKLNLAAAILLSGLLMVQKTSFIPIAFGLSLALILFMYKKIYKLPCAHTKANQIT
jgi:hypothetical protein